MACCAVTVGCELVGSRVDCALGAEEVVATTVAKELDGIDLVRVGEGALAAWSEPGGLFVRTLDGNGRGVRSGVRVGPRCGGGVALLARAGGALVACLVHPAGKAEPTSGGVLVYELGSDSRVRATTQVGVAGPASQGVALAEGARGVELAWHDGSANGERVWWVRLGAGEPPAPRLVSDEARIAAGPAIARHDAGTLVVWSEQSAQGKTIESRILTWSGEGRPSEVARLAYLYPTPRVVSGEEGLVLAFRERPASDQKPGLYLASVSASGTALGARVRLGRADGVAPPALVACQGGLVAAVPRTYGGDYFVGLHWIGRELGRRRGGQQFYEDAHAYTQAAVACLDDHALLLVAEHAALDRDTTALRAVRYACR